jgi:hypothetical protein
MKYADINKKFAVAVTDYMSKGYTINTSSMSGSQGEVAKIDLTNGKEIIRVLLRCFTDYRNDVEGYEIIVGKNTNDVKPNRSDRWGTIWNGDLEVVETIRFYQISRDNDDRYGTYDEAKSASDLRNARWEARHIYSKTEDITDKAMAIAKKYIRRKLGVKRIYESRIKVTHKKDVYFITYCDKSYRLH